MSDLLRVVERSRENAMFVEHDLAREHPGAGRGSDRAAGGRRRGLTWGVQRTGRRKRSTARSPILWPCSIPSSTALRKWNPTRMREIPFSCAAAEKVA
jgi:hypothetical protein